MEKILKVWLAEDDEDDRMLFRSSVKTFHFPVQLTVVYNGEELMELLKHTVKLPDIIFLDLNMPRKDGLACLTEIKKSERLKIIHIIILSTSFRKMEADQLYELGAQYYIRKPDTFLQLESAIHTAIHQTVSSSRLGRTPENQFIISEK